MSFKDRMIGKIFTALPSLGRKAAEGILRDEEVTMSTEIPWTPFIKELKDAKVALVTTAGVHLKGDTPFDMKDPNGDPSLRVIPNATELKELTITHDYYDHSDADRDMNIVFPIERLKELQGEGLIGSLATEHYGLMGHLKEGHVRTLIEDTAPEIARRLLADNVDVVLLTPG